MINHTIATDWFKAFNAHNLEALLVLYSENARHFSPKLKIKHPETKGLIVGKNNLRKWWQESFEALPSLSYHPNFIISEGDKIFMEYTRKVNGENDLIVGELLVIDNGLIVESKVYHS